MSLSHCIALSLMLCAIGVYGILTRRNLIGILLSVEVILNGANINFAAFAHFKATDPAAGAIVSSRQGSENRSRVVRGLMFMETRDMGFLYTR